MNELCERYPHLKPLNIVLVQRDGWSHYGEVMSYPTPDETVMVRRVIDHPGTLEELPAIAVKAVARADWPKHLHYAIVAGLGQFPVDMLRYDFASPLNFRLDLENRDNRSGVALLPEFEAYGGELIVVATSRNLHQRAWCKERWQSFRWAIRELRVDRMELRP